MLKSYRYKRFWVSIEVLSKKKRFENARNFKNYILNGTPFKLINKKCFFAFFSKLKLEIYETFSV